MSFDLNEGPTEVHCDVSEANVKSPNVMLTLSARKVQSMNKLQYINATEWDQLSLTGN